MTDPAPAFVAPKGERPNDRWMLSNGNLLNVKLMPWTMGILKYTLSMAASEHQWH